MLDFELELELELELCCEDRRCNSVQVDREENG